MISNFSWNYMNEINTEFVRFLEDEAKVFFLKDLVYKTFDKKFYPKFVKFIYKNYEWSDKRNF